ncbi:hypothetical protein [Aureimonas sp. AU40]|uniref:hypothetical protein n=1 Tax=Aureimonas sp. AU40 TaxID=1637747 RepID=UPI000784BEE3|nr:hypothetical protein [Aureimonas sp. AU40]
MAAFGLQVWDAQGRLTVNTDRRLVSILGYTDVGNDGFLDHGGFLRGTPAWFVQPLPNGQPFNFSMTPRIWMEGATRLRWAYQGSPALGQARAHRIIFGTR